MNPIKFLYYNSITSRKVYLNSVGTLINRNPLKFNQQFYAKKNASTNPEKNKSTQKAFVNPAQNESPFERLSYRSKSKKTVSKQKEIFINHILPKFIKNNCPPMITKNELPKDFEQGFLYQGEKSYYGSRWMYRVNLVGHNGSVRQVYLFEPLKFQFENFEHPLSDFEAPTGATVNEHPAIKAFKAQQILLWRNFFDKQATENKLNKMGLEKIRCPWNN